MIKREEKRELFDVWVCEKEPFNQMYIKNTVLSTWENIEKVCIVLNSVIPDTENIIIAYDLKSNR